MPLRQPVFSNIDFRTSLHHLSNIAIVAQILALVVPNFVNNLRV